MGTYVPIIEAIAPALKAGAIVSAEEHNVIGGLGSAVARCLALHAPVPMEQVGVSDRFGESGKWTQLLDRYGLNAAGVAAAAATHTIVMPGENDGGAATNDLLMQMQTEILGATVERPSVTETTALGAAFFAGLAEELWSSTDELAGLWRGDPAVEPAVDRRAAEVSYRRWLEAVKRSRGWAPD